MNKFKTSVCVGALVAVNSAMAATSFNLADYQSAHSKTIKFYGAQRCGDGDNWLLKNHNVDTKCHMEDGPDLQAGLDLTGGWHDAGDFIKFTKTISWAAYVLLKGYDAFPTAYADNDDINYSGTANGVPDVLDEVKYATDYLIKAVISDNQVIARVAGNQDHDLLYTSPTQSLKTVAQGGGKRPVYASITKADIAGITAATLALMAKHYKAYDATYANQLLVKADQAYTYAKANPGITIDGSGYYDENGSEYQDAMLCGAIELHRAGATKENYLTAAKGWNKSSPHYWIIDWGTHWDLGRHSMWMAGETSVVANWKSDVNNYLTKVSANQYVSGMAHFGDWGALRYAQNAAFSAALMYQVSGESKYKDFAIGQADYALGNNTYNRSFIVGFGNNSPKNAHHKNANGSDAGSAWTWNNPSTHLLVGAMVAGPTSKATDVSAAGYADDIRDYVGNEVTLDYNSGLVGTLAFAVYENTPVGNSSSLISSSMAVSSSVLSSSSIEVSSSALSSSSIEISSEVMSSSSELMSSSVLSTNCSAVASWSSVSTWGDFVQGDVFTNGTQKAKCNDHPAFCYGSAGDGFANNYWTEIENCELNLSSSSVVSSSSDVVVPVVKEEVEGISLLSSKQGLKVYSKNLGGLVEVINLAGQKLASTQLTQTEHWISLDVGVYFVRIMDGETNKLIKIVIP